MFDCGGLGEAICLILGVCRDGKTLNIATKVNKLASILLFAWLLLIFRHRLHLYIQVICH